MKTISIAMATFNGEKYIAQQLESIESQTQLPDEVIITDDMSSDGTWDLLVSYAGRSSLNVKIYRNDERLGFRKNFMKAASLSTSELIAFCDQDDIWMPTKIERCISFFDDPSLLMCHHDAFVMGRETDEVESIGNDGIEHHPVQANPMRRIWGCPRGFTQVFKTSLNHFSSLQSDTLDQNSAMDAPMAHDQWYYFLATALGKTKFVHEKLAYYRQHSDNVFGLDKAKERKHLTSQASNGLAEFSRRSNAATARSLILDRVVEACAEIEHQFDLKQASSIADLYLEMADVYSRRAISYGDAHSARAFRAVAKNLIGGWYIGWGTPRLGLAPMLKDILFTTRRAIKFR